MLDEPFVASILKKESFLINGMAEHYIHVFEFVITVVVDTVLGKLIIQEE